jgi:hypothetical protein
MQVPSSFNISSDSGIDMILSKEKERLSKVEARRELVANTSNRDDTDKWLIQTRWKEVFAGKNMVTLVKARCPAEDHETSLIWVKKIFDGLIQWAIETLNATPLEVLRWLNSPKPEEAHVQP